MTVIDAKFAEALRGEGRGFGPGGSGAPAPIVKPEPRKVRDGDIHLGTGSNGDQVGVSLDKLVDGRLLIQGNSGAGKSMLLRRLFEQAWGRVQQLLIDVDGEFSTIAEKFDVAVVKAADVQRIGGEAFGRHIRRNRYSAILDLSDATTEDRFVIVADLVTALVEAPAELWFPMLVLIDETQSLAPRYDPGDVEVETRKRTIRALADAMTRGRKRGLAGIVATSRIAETSTPVIAKPTNIIVGRTIFDRDLERAGDVLGFTSGHSRALRTLSDGEFIGIGPAFNIAGRSRFKAGGVETRHKGEAPKIEAPPQVSAADAIAMLAQVDDAPEGSEPAELRVRQVSRTGGRGIDWLQAHDKIIRDGYEVGTPLAEIGAQLAAAGLQVSTSGISTRAHALGLISQKAMLGWQPEEDAILVEEYGKETRIIDIVTKLAENGFSRGRVAVQMRAIALGITRDRVNYWTDDETKIALAGLNEGKTTREIIADLKAAGFERGVTGITKFAQKHGISRNSAVPWTDGDIETLTTMYTANQSVAEIMQKLDRSRGAILSMASQLGLKQRKPWTDAEKAILQKAHKTGRLLVDVPALLPGRTYATVARMAMQLRLDFNANRKAAKAKAANKAKRK
ncbi:helicase HerA domain-containing protein [Bradyrhizobium sp. CCBAU 51753]|uniref:helicase HerA domain-containing protein n=1 Tax=Bradyrhizobium sp. CCBAU 51753 TaxID=1325100 RepID=UPI00188CC224|nr:DUF87 domain-containing protein [Bradyrhizobium sp. CCBAU 51753]QOZ25342.1 hypothetical protein XH93_18375 [Bradyrhizobium sp. CCBAU 51753]